MKNLITSSLIAMGVTIYPSQASFKSPHELSLGVEGTHYKYTERDLMKLKGYIEGINASYAYTFSNGFFASLEGRANMGKVKLSLPRDSDDDPDIHPSKKSSQKLYEPKFLMGLKFGGSILHIHPYTGIGLRYKEDRFTMRYYHVTAGARGISQYLYIPLGLIGQKEFGAWKITAKGEYDLFIKGWQKQRIKSGSLVNQNDKYKQKKGMGLKGEILLGRNIDSYKIEFGPFINYWQVKKSNTIYKDNEVDNVDKNSIMEIGLKLKLVI